MLLPGNDRIPQLEGLVLRISLCLELVGYYTKGSSLPEEQLFVQVTDCFVAFVPVFVICWQRWAFFLDKKNLLA